jgi:predicted CxxxxCH...CXXCH cytochrome family protein
VDPGAGVTFSYSYASGGGTCSAISCHFNNNATWGTSLKCVDCHSTSPEDHP